MGCLKSIIRKIIFLALLIAFFAFGGFTFVKNLIKKYQNPPREEFIATESNYADFSGVSGDYQLLRNFNIFGYKKISAKYLPTGQKITIYDLKDEKRVSTEDFSTKAIDKKITDLLDATKESLITLEDFEIVQRGIYQAKNKQIPYIKFDAKVKNVPFKKVSGMLAAYSTTNAKAKAPSTKLIITITDSKAYNPLVLSGFARALKF